MEKKRRQHAMTWVTSAKRQKLQEESKANTRIQNTVTEMNMPLMGSLVDSNSQEKYE